MDPVLQPNKKTNEDTQNDSSNSKLPVQMKRGMQPQIKRGMQQGYFTQTKNDKLPETVQTKMENSFGEDFSDVNIHDNSTKAEDLGAKAFAQGKDVHFAPGEFQPNTKDGQELIGHELTHVVQQKEGKVQGGEVNGKDMVNQDPSLEKEADDAGKLASEGKEVEVSGLGSGVQMKGDGKISEADLHSHLNSYITNWKGACQTGVNLFSSIALEQRISELENPTQSMMDFLISIFETGSAIMSMFPQGRLALLISVGVEKGKEGLEKIKNISDLTSNISKKEEEKLLISNSVNAAYDYYFKIGECLEQNLSIEVANILAKNPKDMNAAKGLFLTRNFSSQLYNIQENKDPTINSVEVKNQVTSSLYYEFNAMLNSKKILNDSEVNNKKRVKQKIPKSDGFLRMAEYFKLRAINDVISPLNHYDDEIIQSGPDLHNLSLPSCQSLYHLISRNFSELNDSDRVLLLMKVNSIAQAMNLEFGKQQRYREDIYQVTKQKNNKTLYSEEELMNTVNNDGMAGVGGNFTSLMHKRLLDQPLKKEKYQSEVLKVFNSVGKLSNSLKELAINGKSTKLINAMSIEAPLESIKFEEYTK